MKKSIASALVTVAAIGLPIAVQAQYVGPSTQPQAQSVAEILKNSVDDQKVVLKGHITKKVGKKKYMFSDGTGEIRVEIDHDRLPMQRIDDKTLVEISGEVDTEFLKSPEIDVDLVSVLK